MIRWTVRPLDSVTGYSGGFLLDSSIKMIKEVLPMSAYEIVMVIFTAINLFLTVIELLIVILNSFKNK